MSIPQASFLWVHNFKQCAILCAIFAPCFAPEHVKCGCGNGSAHPYPHCFCTTFPWLGLTLYASLLQPTTQSPTTGLQLLQTSCFSNCSSHGVLCRHSLSPSFSETPAHFLKFEMALIKIAEWKLWKRKMPSTSPWKASEVSVSICVKGLLFQSGIVCFLPPSLPLFLPHREGGSGRWQGQVGLQNVYWPVFTTHGASLSLPFLAGFREDEYEN